MVQKEQISRKTTVNLAPKEVEEAILNYLVKMGIKDVDQFSAIYLTVKETHKDDENGYYAQIEITNYNADSNLEEKIKKGN